MVLIRPRLTDYHHIYIPQSELDFAIPFFEEDIPLYVDPFLLWKSPSYQDRSLHGSIVNSFNHLGYLKRGGKIKTLTLSSLLGPNAMRLGLGFPRIEKESGSGRNKQSRFLRFLIRSLSMTGEASPTSRRSSSSLTASQKTELAILPAAS